MIEREMFYGALPDVFAKAKILREIMTEAENVLWQQLQKNKLGVRFKPQHPVDVFILDFYCHKLKLAIEVDGKIHEAQQDYDKGRESELENFGIKVIRFTNDEVLYDNVNVILKIKEELLKSKT